MNIKTVTVIGASGTMGCNISAIFASFGNAKVFMLDFDKNDASIERAIKSVRADSVRHNLILADFSMLDECVGQSDLVFESVIENIDVKKDIAVRCSKHLKNDAFICTGTSGLSIDEIASVLPLEVRDRYYGVHFFNPPYSMPLCELIRSKYSNDSDVAFLKEYLDKQLNRTTVVCRDKPAFLANRIGFFFINNALRLASEYADKGGIDYIDSIFGTFTGRSMAPCATADFVGLDVHKAIVGNLLANTNDYCNKSFILPDYVEKLINNKFLGRKSGIGLFKMQLFEDGSKKLYVYDIKNDNYREKRNYVFDFAVKIKNYLRDGDYLSAIEVLIKDGSTEAMICRRLLKEYIDYSIFVGKEVCEDLSFIDDAMACGFNWCPPLSLSNLLFGTNYQTKYDYRPFFKVGK